MNKREFLKLSALTPLVVGLNTEAPVQGVHPCRPLERRATDMFDRRGVRLCEGDAVVFRYFGDIEAEHGLPQYGVVNWSVNGWFIWWDSADSELDILREVRDVKVLIDEDVSETIAFREQCVEKGAYLFVCTFPQPTLP